MRLQRRSGHVGIQRLRWLVLPVLAATATCTTTPPTHGTADSQGTVSYHFALRNPLTESRSEEVVELPLPASLDASQPLVAVDDRSGDVLALQRHAASDTTDRALVLVSLGARERRTITVHAATRDTPPHAVVARAYGRHVPERKDDFAWENDRIAFRMYGPALAATGEISSGIDVWAKRVRAPVIDRWYARDDYHTDHGDGLDFYKVGTSRGCGGLAMLDGDQLAVSGNYLRWRRLAAGPLRVVFELDYAQWGAAGARIVETKRITLDAGSNFSRVESRFTAQAQPRTLPIAIGLKRAREDEATHDTLGRWASVWSAPQDTHGEIGCAAILPRAGRALNQDGHLLLAVDHDPAMPFAYYVGAAWSQGLDFASARAWNAYVATYARRLAAPIEVAAIQ